MSCLYKLEYEKIDEHAKGLGGFDFHPLHGLFVSGGPDMTVKVFNLKKQILREIRFPQPVTGIAFSNAKGDLLVGPEEKISLIRFDQLEIKGERGS